MSKLISNIITIKMELDFSEYGKDEENRESIKERLEEKNFVFKIIVEEYEKALRNNPALSESLKNVIDDSIDREVESKDEPFVEPLKTIYDELHQIKGGIRREFQINDETRKYLSRHSEVKLYRVKVKEMWHIRRAPEEVHECNFYLFDISEDKYDLKKRIQDRQRYIHLSNHCTPVRNITVDVLEVEQLDLKCLDDLVE
ncbi:hypothetical protein KY342_06455 [Candidatus Woesearchaeota archaeon]|nr:hypothetical protein [Candidatus Woesearchaeota archaeon]